MTDVIVENGRAVGVQLADGETIQAKRIVSNATRWDTFAGEGSPKRTLVGQEDTPKLNPPGAGAINRRARFFPSIWVFAPM